MSMQTMYGNSPRITDDDGTGPASKSYLAQLALSKRAKHHGVVHSFRKTMQHAQSATQSVAKMGYPLVRWVIENVPKFTAQRPNESTIQTAVGNRVGASVNKGWSDIWASFARQQGIPLEQLQPAADATEAVFTAELGCDHARLHPSGIVVHDGQRYARSNVAKWQGVMWDVQARHNVPEPAMHDLANRLTGFARQVRPLVIHRAR